MGREPPPPGPGWAGAGGSGSRGDPGQPHPPPSGLGLQLHSLLLPKPCLAPRLDAPGGPVRLDGAVPLAAGAPLAPSTLLPAQQEGQQDSRQHLHPVGAAARLLTRVLAGPLDLWEVGQRTLPGASRRPWTPQLQPQTMGLTLAPRPGTGPGKVISLPDSRGWVGEGKSLWLAPGRPVHLCGSALALRPQPSSAGRPAHCPMSGPQGPRPRSRWPHGPSSCRPLSRESSSTFRGPLVKRISKKSTIAVLPLGLPVTPALCSPTGRRLPSLPPQGLILAVPSAWNAVPANVHEAVPPAQALPPQRSLPTITSHPIHPLRLAPALQSSMPAIQGGVEAWGATGSLPFPATALLPVHCVWAWAAPLSRSSPAGRRPSTGAAEKPLPGGHGREGAGAGEVW